ncbi:serine hydrolase domain-containing protein [Thermodesulfobacterium hveragerdense]|uniref:serine hydrolase domain-containing protein n=1 Tax=Thermodesulfobacterium hveragerdense TaxID=53424 RepID=UPI000409C6DF|nr:serine hydrolase [Thermodesulfobacterium hveragerdense]
MKILNRLFELLNEGVKKEVFPGAVAGVYFQQRRYIVGAGYQALIPYIEPIEENTIFDLASLTKPLALVLGFLDFLAKNPKALDLYSPVKNYLDLKPPLSEIPVYRLFNHTSGLKAWHPFYQEILEKNPEKPLEYIVRKIEETPLEYIPGEKSLYSDLGYFILTHLLESLSGEPLEKIFEQAKKRISLGKKSFIGFNPLKKGIDQEYMAPTSVCPWVKKLLRGVVEDENTRALGGVSGVAGLFGNIYGVLDVLEFLLNVYQKGNSLFTDLLKTFIFHREKDSEYALGFMLPNPKEKELLKAKISSNTLRHTGFTGTSFLIDFDQGIIIVLLSNRVHPTRDNLKIRDFRHYFHQQVIEALN